MREIKFRGIDANGVMRYGRLSQDKPDSTLYYSEYSQRICWDSSNIPVSNNTLGQYTGLKDKNGVQEVYEGDIIDAYGIIKGNIYEMDKGETDLVIEGFGTSAWSTTEKAGLERGLKYTE